MQKAKLLTMKKNTGVILFLVSIALTSTGSVFKIMNQFGMSEVFLWAGVLTFIVALVLIIVKLASKKNGSAGA